MNYQKVYFQLVEDAKAHRRIGYTETHHIVPRSEGGSDDKDNLVDLTGRQHYIAHLLLAKIYNDYKMYCAVIYMQTRCHKNRNFKFNSRLYEKMRIAFSKSISGSNNPNFGKPGARLGKHHTKETRQLLSEIGKTKTGKENNFYGRRHSESARKKMSEARIGKSSWRKGLSTEECLTHITKEDYESMKKKCSESMKGKVFWNNGVISIRAYECPPGFTKGRLAKKKSSSK